MEVRTVYLPAYLKRRIPTLPDDFAIELGPSCPPILDQLERAGVDVAGREGKIRHLNRMADSARELCSSRMIPLSALTEFDQRIARRIVKTLTAKPRRRALPGHGKNVKSRQSGGSRIPSHA